MCECRLGSGHHGGHMHGHGFGPHGRGYCCCYGWHRMGHPPHHHGFFHHPAGGFMTRRRKIEHLEEVRNMLTEWLEEVERHLGELKKKEED